MRLAAPLSTVLAMSTNNGQGKVMDDRIVIPAQAGIHFDLDGRNMDSRLRGNDEVGECAGF